MSVYMSVAEFLSYLDNAIFGTCHFGGVSRNEMVHHLVGREFRDGRKNTKGITGQQDQVLRVATDTRNFGIGDVI